MVRHFQGATALFDSEQKLFTTRLAKYARRKGLNCQIGAILGNTTGDGELAAKLSACGRYLAFNQYLASGQIKLACGNFCNLHMLCPCCAAARSRRLLARWLPLVFNPGNQNKVKHYLCTLSWPPPAKSLAMAAEPGDDLRVNLAVGQIAWRKLWKRRTNRLSGPLADVLGAILATEVTRGPSGNWHPHFHVLVTMPENKRISASDLRQEWSKLTGGRQLRLDPLRLPSDVVEVFKYVVKPADLGKGGKLDSAGVMTRFEIWQALKGARLVRGFGCYYGVQDEDLTQPEDVQETAAYIELVFKWMDKTYSLVSTRGTWDSRSPGTGSAA